jgi:hypothetical protein
MADPYIMIPGARLYMEGGHPVESMGAVPSADGSCNCPPSLDGFKETWEEMRLPIGIVGTATATYHGYKRNKSVGWALAWGACALFLSPVITNVVAVAQGFGKRKRG